MSDSLMFTGAISHPKMNGTYRVPMCVEEPVYTLYVKHNISRSLYRHDLPDEIKTKIAFINSIQSPTTFGQTEPSWYQVYDLPKNEELHDVGWRVTENIYCLVLDGLTIDSLVGKTLNKELA